jgi:hypothetical protein
MKLKALFLFLLSAVAFGGTAHAGSSDVFTLSGGAPNYQVSLSGTLSRTLYRTEYYESTCYRTESYTDYETRCTPIMERRCTDTSPVCRNVCRDVMRPVCNSNGCQDFLTRECTEECHGGGQSCDTVVVGNDCRQFPVTRYREIPYSCTKSHEVPYGTEVVDERVTNVSIQLSGDIASLSGKDKISLQVPNGLDASDYDLSVTSSASANTHLIYAVKVSSEKRSVGDRRTEANVVYSIRVVEKGKVKVPASKLESLKSDEKNIAFVLLGAPVDSNTRIQVTIEKDQLLGGLKTVVNTAVPNTSIKFAAAGAGKQRGLISLQSLGYEYNRRPHGVTVSFIRDLTSSLSSGLLNPGILSSMNVKSSGSLKIGVRFK